MKAKSKKASEETSKMKDEGKSTIDKKKKKELSSLTTNEFFEQDFEDDESSDESDEENEDISTISMFLLIFYISIYSEFCYPLRQSGKWKQ